MGGLPWGGSEALWHAVASCALSQGDQVLVSVYDWGELHEKVRVLQNEGAVVHTRRRFNPNAGMFERIRRFVKHRRPRLDKDYQTIIAFKPDAVFISQGDSFDLAIHHRPLYQLLRENGIPYFLVCHNHVQYSFLPPKEIFPGAIDIFQNAGQVYFVSQRQWRLTERRLAKKILNGCFTWNPLNVTIPSSALEWRDHPKASFAIVGNLVDSKGHDTALEVLSKGEWKNRNWELNIYGEGDGLAYLQALASFYELEGKVNFRGYAKDLTDVWRENHLLLIPSAGEGLPISLVEAMVCGRPAVVTDVGGNAELISDGKNGFVALSPTTEAFSTAMERAWVAKENWRQLGVNSFVNINEVLEKDPAQKIYDSLKNLNW